MSLHKFATLTDLPPGEARAFDIAGRRIAVFNANGTLHAIDDECPHQGASLAEGSVTDNCVTCPWHGAEFDICTGKVLTPPATEDLRSYKIVVAGDDLSVEIE